MPCFANAAARLTEYVSIARAAEDAAPAATAVPNRSSRSRAASRNTRIRKRDLAHRARSADRAPQDHPGPKTIVLLSEGMIVDPRRVDLSGWPPRPRRRGHDLRAGSSKCRVRGRAGTRCRRRSCAICRCGMTAWRGGRRGPRRGVPVGRRRPAPFERIARELSGYYLLAFEALETERDGRTHRVRVTLAARRRRGPGAHRPSPCRPRRPDPPCAQLVSLLRTLTVATELPVRVATYALCRAWRRAGCAWW